MSRTDKASIVDGLSSRLESAPFVALADYRGISVEQVNALRNKFREAGMHYEVIKNKLAKRAIAGSDKEAMNDLLVGMTAWIISGEDPIAAAKVLKAEQERTGIKLLWGTACLFANPRYMHGAATSCNADAFAYAAAQVKKAIEVTHQLGGEGYTFWGGREGYSTLWNTDIGRELDHLGAFLQMAVDHKKKIGFKGQFYIEPKPKEPTKHQYDSDAAACLNFLRQYNLMDHFKLNLETNHATLAGHEMQHEMEVAVAAGALGSIDANTGDPMLGWDTDQFPTSIYLTTECMLPILKMGGFSTGGVNFDAKVRRESFEPEDLFHAHVGGMDAFARGLRIAAAIRADGRLEEFVKNRYRSWDSGIGKKIESGKASFKSLETYILKKGEVSKNESGRQEFLENLINEFI